MATLLEGTSKAVQNRVVKEMTGGKGGPTVAKELNASKVKSPSGNPWTTGMVQRLFKQVTGTEDLKTWREKHRPTKKAAAKASAPKRATAKRTTAKRSTAKRNGAKRGGSARKAA